MTNRLYSSLDDNRGSGQVGRFFSAESAFSVISPSQQGALNPQSSLSASMI